MPLCGEDHAKLIARINRIQGQVGGIKRMMTEGKDCVQVLKQIAAATGALRSLGAVLLEDHLKGCVATAMKERADNPEQINQVVELFKKFSR